MLGTVPIKPRGMCGLKASMIYVHRIYLDNRVLAVYLLIGNLVPFIFHIAPFIFLGSVFVLFKFFTTYSSRQQRKTYLTFVLNP